MKSDASLVGFTVLTQAAVGTSWGLAASFWWLASRAGDEIADAATSSGAWAVPLVTALATAASLAHLGRPDRAWRATANVRTSWLSREVGAATLFLAASALPLLLPGPRRGAPLAIAATAGALLLLAMARTYRLRTVPAWNMWAPGALFVQTTLAAGGAATALVLAAASPHARTGVSLLAAAATGAGALLAGPLLLRLWWHKLERGDVAAREAARRLARGRGLSLARTGAAVIGAALLVVTPPLEPPWRVTLLALALAFAIAGEAMGRVLFYRARVRIGL